MPERDPNKYPLTYDVRQEDPPLSADEVRHLSRNAADAVVILSMIYPPDGSYSLLIVSLDGRTGEEVTDNELWKAWTMLSERLARSKTLAEPKRSLAATVFECVETALRASTAAMLAMVPEGDDLGERIKRMLDVIPSHERMLQTGLRVVSAGFQSAPAKDWYLWRDSGTTILEQALMQRPSQPWIERVKAIWLGRE